jgi:WD40 repeat protein
MKNSLLHYIILLTAVVSLPACLSDKVKTSDAINTQHYSDKVLKAADISNDGTYSLISDNNQVCLWNNHSNKKAYPCLTGLEAQFIELLGISSSQRYFYTSNRVNVHWYDLDSGRLITVWTAGDNIINDISISADDSSLIFGFRSGQVSIASTTTTKISTFQIHELDINSVSLSSNGALALTGSSDKQAKIWQTNNGEIVHNFSHQSRVNHVSLSADGSKAFTLDAIQDHYFWQVSKGQKLAKLQSNIRFIAFNDSTFSFDNTLLFSASAKQKAQAWRTSDGELIAQWQAFKQEKRYRSSVLKITQINLSEVATITSDGVYQTWSLPAVDI